MGKHDGKERKIVYLTGEIAKRCTQVKATTGVSTAALTRTALLEWFRKHEGEPGVEKIQIR